MTTQPISKKTVQLNVVYLILGAGVLFGIGGAVGGGIAAVAMKVVGRKVDAVVNNVQPAPKPKYTREELRGVAIGKNEQEIMEMFGKPKTTSGSGGFGTWYYDRICYDRVTDKADTFTGLKFQNGVVVSFSF